MRKKRLWIMLAICMLCVAGCDSEIEKELLGSESTEAQTSEAVEEDTLQITVDFASNRTNITEYQSSYQDEVREIKESSYGNISFSDCEFMALEGVQSVGVYRLYSEELGVDESIEIIENWLEEIGCEDIDVEKELRDASGQYESSSAEYPYDYPAVYDYYPEFASGHGFFINTNKCYIQMGTGGIYSMSDGTITSYLGLDSLAAMDALGVNEETMIEKGRISDIGDNVWELTDGEMSIAEAAGLAQDYFEAGTPMPLPSGVQVDIPEVKVFALSDVYGFECYVRRVYNGVPFAYTLTGARTYYSDDYELAEDMKKAYVINHDTVAAFTGYADAEQLEGVIEEQEDIISLKNAVLLFEDFFADNMMLDVDTAGLVYCPYVDEAGNRIAYPCWQFVGINQTNNRSMRVYVNALSGDIYYYSYVED